MFINKVGIGDWILKTKVEKLDLSWRLNELIWDLTWSAHLFIRCGLHVNNWNIITIPVRFCTIQLYEYIMISVFKHGKKAKVTGCQTFRHIGYKSPFMLPFVKITWYSNVECILLAAELLLFCKKKKMLQKCSRIFVYLAKKKKKKFVIANEMNGCLRVTLKV